MSTERAAFQFLFILIILLQHPLAYILISVTDIKSSNVLALWKCNPQRSEGICKSVIEGLGGKRA